MNKKFAIFLFVLVFFGLAFAGASGIITAMSSLCSTAKTVMLAAMMLLTLLAAVTYAAGQMMGAETRARATVWATAMITGAIIGGIIYAVTPTAISYITGSAVSSYC